jgi:hypothetical protein
VLTAAITGLALAQQQPFYAVAPVGLAVIAVLGLLAEAGVRRGIRVPRAIAFARSVGVVNIAFAIGWINVARGRRYETWTPGSRVAEPVGAAVMPPSSDSA